MATNDCEGKLDGFSVSDMVLTGCLSFLAGISAVVLFIILMKWRAERKWCFKEKEEPFKGKWEGASRKPTLQVLKKHTLERSGSERVETKQPEATGEANIVIELTDPDNKPVEESVKETSFNADVEHTLSGANNNAEVHNEAGISNKSANAEDIEEKSDMNDKETKEKTFVILYNETENLTEAEGSSKLAVTNDSQSHTVESKIENQATVSPDDIVNIQIITDDLPKVSVTEQPVEPGMNSSNESLKAVQLYESDRGSSVFEPLDLVIQNDNFRISKLSVN